MFRRLALVFGACLIAIGSFAVFSIGPFALIPHALGDDWPWYADGARRFFDPALPLFDPQLLAGAYDRLDPAIEGSWNQLPNVLAPVLVVSHLAGPDARLVWWALTAVAVLAALFLVWPRRVPFAAHLSLGVLLIAQGPIFEVLLWGNLSALSLIGAVLVARRRHPLLTALGIAALALKGPMAAVAVLWLLRAEGRAALRPLLLAGTLVGLSFLPALARFGPEIIGQTVTVVLNSVPTPYLNNLSPALWISWAIDGAPVSLIALLLALPCVVVGLRRPGSQAGLALLLLGVCFLSTTTWPHWYAPSIAVALLAARPHLEPRLRTWFS